MQTLSLFGPFTFGVNPFDASFEVNSLDAQTDDLVDVLFASRGAAERILERQREIASEDLQDEDFFDYAQHYEISSLAEEGFPEVFRIVDHGRADTEIAMLVFDPEEEDLMREVLIRSCEIEQSILETQMESMRQMSLFNPYHQVAA
jgi:hypothetical protein